MAAMAAMRIKTSIYRGSVAPVLNLVAATPLRDAKTSEPSHRSILLFVFFVAIVRRRRERKKATKSAKRRKKICASGQPLANWAAFPRKYLPRKLLDRRKTTLVVLP